MCHPQPKQCQGREQIWCWITEVSWVLCGACKLCLPFLTGLGTKLSCSLWDCLICLTELHAEPWAGPTSLVAQHPPPYLSPPLLNPSDCIYHQIVKYCTVSILSDLSLSLHWSTSLSLETFWCTNAVKEACFNTQIHFLLCCGLKLQNLDVTCPTQNLYSPLQAEQRCSHGQLISL